MRRHGKYLQYVLRHKWYVLVEGLKLRVPIWHLIAHDWSKFLLEEWMPYARAFYKSNGLGHYQPDMAFLIAWNAHEKRHKHHWQYWVLIQDSGEQVPLPMPDRHRREMLADWRGAGKAQGKPDTAGWYQVKKDKMLIHPETRAWIEQQLGLQEKNDGTR